jgi:nucleotide-binding universal stress UspA family protein
MLVHATVMTPAPKTASNRPMLIGYDGSAGAEYAIHAAARLLEPTSAVVLNVAPRLTVGEGLISAGLPVSGDSAYEGLNKDDALRRAEAGARLAQAAGLQADARICAAAPVWEGIVQVGDEVDAAVIVLGSRERRDAAELVERNVSHDVARHARRPLLIVPQSARGRADQGPILLIYDTSEQARRAIEAAQPLLSPREAVVVDAAGAGARGGVDFAQRLGFHAVARTATASTTWRTVVDVADELDASVIVVGSRGLSGPREVIEDSVSHNIATHAHRPVLVVPPSGAGAEGDTLPRSSKA